MVFCLFLTGLFAQKNNHPIANQVKVYQHLFEVIQPTQLLNQELNQNLRSLEVEEEVTDATFFNIEQGTVDLLLENPAELLKLNLPAANDVNLELELYQAQIFTPEFQVYTSSNPNVPFPYEKGLYYWGVVKGKKQSLAAISINRGEIAGFVALNNELYTLGKLNNNDLTILYKDKDLNITPDFECGTDDVLHNMSTGEKVEVTTQRGPDNCVRMYVEVDYDIVVGKGGVTQAADYVTAAFGQVAILYANESIDFTINELFVWNTSDPYTGPSTSNYLTQFRNRLNGNYNGDLAHLVGYDGGGGIAYVDVLCNGFYGVGYSAINSSFNNVPTYSWTVMVLTHEIGHNLGSPHTHNCSWGPNGNEPVDCCGANAGYPENNCSSCNVPDPSNGGTVMSYCHLRSVGINLNNGFGPLPGALIRNEVYNASCLSACSAPVANDAGISAISVPTGSICAGSVNPEVTLSNYGTNALTSVTIEYQVDGGLTSSYNWSGNLATGGSTSVTLPLITYGTGNHTFDANTTSPNGASDENGANDGSSSNFNRPVPSTFYADADGDGYGDPNNSISDCSAPSGYVSDNTDCNDNNASEYPGAPCNDNDDCTNNDVLDSNCGCSGTQTGDSDGDGVCDALDVCPGGDDNVDLNNNGIPDFCDCFAETGNFPNNPLTHSGGGQSSTTFNFAAGDKNPSFTISGLNAKLNGNPNSRYIDQVTVVVDGQTYGTFSGSNTSSANVDVTGVVGSITVYLSDGYDGNANNLSVNLSSISYCGAGAGCPDADNDGVCDADDVCPGFDDNLIGTSCDDLDDCSINDTWGIDCQCTGTATGDSDGDGVCDALDVCPGGDDTIDSDGDGIPDDCDSANCNEVTDNFSPNPLTHSGAGSSFANVTLGGNTDVAFTILNLNRKTNGNSSRRYIEQVTVTYVDGGGSTQTYGSFRGDQQSTVNVSIAGAVQSVSIELEDVYDGSTNSTMTVDMSTVTSCQAGALPQGSFNNTSELPIAVNLFPNPASETIFIELDQTPKEGEVVLYNLLGIEQARFDISERNRLQINLNSLNLGEQILLIGVELPDQETVLKRVVVMKN